MQAIALVDNNWAVSFRNKPIASIPAERKTMLEEIKGKIIIYDLAFVEWLPGQQPVQGCRNLIYLGGVNDTVKGAECFGKLEDIKAAVSGEKEEDIYIIHGSEIYRFFHEDINAYHITKIDYEYKADEYITNLDSDRNFSLVADSDEQYCYDMIYSFLLYRRK